MEPKQDRPTNSLGVYFDPESKKELEAISEPQADAFVKMGWQLKPQNDASANDASQEDQSTNDKKGK